MKKEVVVMSSADVAAMRKACKEAEKAYYQAKVGALEFALQEMDEHAGQEYALHELTAMTGLSPMEVTAQLSWCCQAARDAGICDKNVRRNIRTTERKFVEVTENGTINPESVLTVTRRERTYYILNQKSNRR